MKPIALFSAVILIYTAGCSTLAEESKPVSPPKKIPTAADSLQIADQVAIKAVLYLWQNFMPGPDESGPQMYVSLQLEVKNKSKKKLQGFKPKLLTLYSEGSKTPFHTFKLVSGDSLPPLEIAPGQEEYFTCTNDRSVVFSPKLEKDSKFYGRILLVWNGKERVISTPPVSVEFTY